jgi:eukaryotic-like serine/threonine-protein kinase
VGLLVGLGLCGVGVRSWWGREPPPRESTLAAVAHEAASPEDTWPMKNQEGTAGAAQTRENHGRGALAALLCVGTACAAPQLARSEPPPEECPPGALQAMTEQLGIRLGRTEAVSFEPFDAGMSRPIPVQEGYIEARLIGPLGGMPRHSMLDGRFVFGEQRVYARFTEVRLPDGQRVPICIESWEEGRRGSEVMERTSEPRVIKIFSVVRVKAVDRFK